MSNETRQITVSGPSTAFVNGIDIGPHHLTSDEPVSNGGTDTGPKPHELLCAALGACTSMTISMYARHKQWPLESVTVRLRHLKVPAADCAECETKEGTVDRIERDIELKGPLLNDEQKTRLLEIANKCPVHKTLMSEINIRSRLV